MEVCHPKNHNIGLLAYSPLGGGTLSGKYIDIDSEAAKSGRLNLFPGYMERYNKSVSRVQLNSTHSCIMWSLDLAISYGNCHEPTITKKLSCWVNDT